VGLKVLKELDIVSVDAISVAKDEGRHDRGMTAERVFLPNIKDPVSLKPRSGLLFFLQKVRDEAHRFAITFMRGRKSKSLSSSILDSIAGIGPKKKRILLRHFGSVKKLSEAKEEEIRAVPGIHAGDAAELVRFFKEQAISS
jgi:excinuclease ABC subunit C